MRDKNKLKENKVLIGWKEIASHTPFSPSTLINKYGKRMKRDGFVFKSNVGNYRSPQIWTFPDFVRGFFVMVAKENGGKV